MEWHLAQKGSEDDVPTAFQKVHGGQDCWDYFKENPEREAIFSKAMINTDNLGESANTLL